MEQSYQNNRSKKIFLSVLGVALLMIATAGVSFAFFEYSRTGNAQSIKTGHIEFNSTNTLINLTGAFPVASSSVSSVTESTANVGVATVTITGKTNYSGGVNFTVKAVSVSSNIGTAAGKLPVKVIVTGSNMPTGTTYLGSGAATAVTENAVIASGSIPNTNTAVNGTITIKAFIDGDSILITDTASTATPPSGYTNNTDVTGKTVITTSQWNALNSTAATFKIRVDATEA